MTAPCSTLEFQIFFDSHVALTPVSQRKKGISRDIGFSSSMNVEHLMSAVGDNVNSCIYLCPKDFKMNFFQWAASAEIYIEQAYQSLTVIYP